jgi:hypothetical protein
VSQHYKGIQKTNICSQYAAGPVGATFKGLQRGTSLAFAGKPMTPEDIYIKEKEKDRDKSFLAPVPVLFNSGAFA